MNNLARRSAQIREITSVIAGIAFPTNLLPLKRRAPAHKGVGLPKLRRK